MIEPALLYEQQSVRDLKGGSSDSGAASPLRQLLRRYCNAPEAGMGPDTPLTALGLERKHHRHFRRLAGSGRQRPGFRQPPKAVDTAHAEADRPGWTGAFSGADHPAREHRRTVRQIETGCAPGRRIPGGSQPAIGDPHGRFRQPDAGRPQITVMSLSATEATRIGCAAWLDYYTPPKATAQRNH